MLALNILNTDTSALITIRIRCFALVSAALLYANKCRCTAHYRSNQQVFWLWCHYVICDGIVGRL